MNQAEGARLQRGLLEICGISGLRTEPASSHLFRPLNFGIVSALSENMWAPALQSHLKIIPLGRAEGLHVPLCLPVVSDDFNDLTHFVQLLVVAYSYSGPCHNHRHSSPSKICLVYL